MDHPLPSFELSQLNENRDGSWKQRILHWFGKRAPGLAAKLLDTQQQVDVVIEDYQQRCASLGKLVQEGRAVQALLETEQREAESSGDSAATEFQQQIALQRSELEVMQLEHARLSARLVSLKSQRDALQLRLKAAENRFGKGQGRQPSNKHVLRWAIAGGALLIAGVIATLFFRNLFSPQTKSQQTTANAKASQPVAANVPAVNNTPASTPAASNPTLETGLIHHWSFDEKTGDAANDALGGNEVVLGDRKSVCRERV